MSWSGWISRISRLGHRRCGLRCWQLCRISLMAAAENGSQRQCQPCPQDQAARTPLQEGIHPQEFGPLGWSMRSARLRRVSATLRMAVMDSLRTCGTTASFT